MAPKNDITLTVTGMTCGGCVKSVTRVLNAVEGVTSADVDLAAGRAVVRGDADPQSLVKAVEGAGFGAEIAG
jgi:copper chaperone CopZ